MKHRHKWLPFDFTLMQPNQPEQKVGTGAMLLAVVPLEGGPTIFHVRVGLEACEGCHLIRLNPKDLMGKIATPAPLRMAKKKPGPEHRHQFPGESEPYLVPCPECGEQVLIDNNATVVFDAPKPKVPEEP